MVQSVEEIRKHYLFTGVDERNLIKLNDVLIPHAEQFSIDFYNYIKSFAETAALFPTEQSVDKRKQAMASWLSRLLHGNYGNQYLHELRRVGQVHVKNEIPIHWVTASMNFKREYLINILESEIEDQRELANLSRSLNKILDINLDVLLSSYHDEELKEVFIGRRADTMLIAFAERFAYGLNIILVLALIGISFGVIYLFGSEIFDVMFGGKTTNIITALGTLLIIWVMIELISTEIKYLKGKKFQIEVFVSVALVAFIRELLISSLGEGTYIKLGVSLSAVLVLGIVYFLIAKSKTNI